MELLKAILAAGILSYLGLMLIAWLLAPSILFPAFPSTYQDSDVIRKIPYGRAGLRISALYLPAEASAPLVIVSHGNGEDLGHVLPQLERFRQNGFSVLGYDYPGYGTSQGAASEHSVHQSMEAVYQYAIDVLQVAPMDIVLFGRSLGAGPSLKLASERPVGAIVIESPFISAFRVMTRVRLLPWDMFNNLHYGRQVEAPILVIHGTDDKTVPFRHGTVLAEELPTVKSYLWIESAGHNDLELVAGESYWETIREFISESLASGAADKATTTVNTGS